jgi:hypothetical protein
MWNVVFCAVTPCIPTHGYQRFGGTYVVHIQGINRLHEAQNPSHPSVNIKAFLSWRWRRNAGDQLQDYTASHTHTGIHVKFPWWLYYLIKIRIYMQRLVKLSNIKFHENPFSCYMLTEGRTDIAKMTVFWDVAPCSRVEIYQRFRGAYFLHHQWAPLKRRSFFTRLHGETPRETVMFILVAARTWNLTQI